MFRPYNRNVLVGNWFEDRVLEEDTIKDYLEKRENGQLLTQKFPSKNDNTSISLTTVNDDRVHIGDCVLLKCDGNAASTSLIPKAARQNCYIGNTGEPSPALGLTTPEISFKSALVVKSVDGSAPGTPIRFGQAFALTNFDGSLFLQSELRSYSKAAPRSRLQSIEFVDVYTHQCDWVATCLNPKFRLEAEGSEVQANEKIVILHMKTNKALAVVADFTNSSRFEIVANTFLDSHKAEEDVNHWRFVTNKPEVVECNTR